MKFSQVPLDVEFDGHSSECLVSEHSPFTLFAGVIRDRTHHCLKEAVRCHVCMRLVSLEAITETGEEKLSRVYLAARMCRTGTGRAETPPVLASDWHLWWH